MTNTVYKVGDMVRNETGCGFLEEFGIIYDIDIGSDPYDEPLDEPLVKIHWQTTQRTIVYYLSTVEERVNRIQQWIHYPA